MVIILVFAWNEWALECVILVQAVALTQHDILQGNISYFSYPKIFRFPFCNKVLPGKHT
jgi:hypothetical protein